uniref:RNA-directed RNA polymerase n=1 Tax=Sanmenxia Parti tick virus 1 TaxID=2972277 RepID=A0A9E7V251_9VIRU|nr:MAG: putative RNA-dependent RNA polymerase [Sanmenxia Parti tick virus 1]
MTERAGISFRGVYRTSARGRAILRQLGSPQEKISADWDMLHFFGEEYGLRPEEDNKSVFNPGWLWRGLAKYAAPGESIPSTIAEQLVYHSGPKFEHGLRIDGQREGQSHPDLQGCGTSSPGNADPKGTRRGRRAHDGPCGDTSASRLDYRRRATVPVYVRPSDGGNGCDSVKRTSVYADAVNAAFRVAGNRSRGYKLLDVDTVLRNVLHMDKSAGLPFFGRVRDHVDRARELAERVRLGDRSFDPYVAFRRIQHGSSGSKGRLVWGSPLSTTILASQYSKAAFQGLRNIRAFAFGAKRSTHGSYVTEFQSKYRRVYSLDFSGFDQTIPAHVIGDAFEILKTWLDMSEEEERFFYRLTYDFIHSTIVMPDGLMYQKHRGVPSGSPFTSLIGSISNLIILQYVWIRLTGKAIDEFELAILGDDSIVATNANPSLKSIASAAAELGMVVSPQKSQVATGPSEVVSFLGYDWLNGWPHRDKRELVQRIVFPERHTQWSLEYRNNRLYGYSSLCIEAYDLVLEYLHYKDVKVDATLRRLAGSAKEYGSTVGSSGPGVLRYRESEDKEFVKRDQYGRAILTVLGTVA